MKYINFGIDLMLKAITVTFSFSSAQLILRIFHLGQVEGDFHPGLEVAVEEQGQ